jgi:ABC-type Fe3+ transport system substrate-binding protein
LLRLILRRAAAPFGRQTLSIMAAWLSCFSMAMAAPRVVVITPHVDAIRSEFGAAFARWHEEQFGERAEVDWRFLGGTSDALRFVQSEFAKKPEGIGLDIFFGGGQEPFLLLTDKKLGLRYQPPPEILAGIPQNLRGMEIYDKEFMWFGAVLSSFGILQNTRVQRLLGLPAVQTWGELTNARLQGWIGAGDPRNSGTMNVMFESFLQFYGWDRGWQVLTQIGGNVRKFDRVSSTTAKDVTLGETAYAFCIDFYGFTQIAVAGQSNLSFALPNDFAVLNPDGIALLKGAPNLTTAQRFMDFVLSEAGQRIWFLPAGQPEGPRQFSIERPSIRPALYERYQSVRRSQLNPFVLGEGFFYDAKLGRRRREIVSALIGALLVDTHAELQPAWRRVAARGLRPAEVEELGRPPITEAMAMRLSSGLWTNPAVRLQSNIAWQSWAQSKYRRLAKMPPVRVDRRTASAATPEMAVRSPGFGPHRPPRPVEGGTTSAH